MNAKELVNAYNAAYGQHMQFRVYIAEPDRHEYYAVNPASEQEYIDGIIDANEMPVNQAA